MPQTPFDFLEQNEYEHGFCECYKNPLSCIVSFFAPCIAVGNTAGKLQEGEKGFNVWSCLCFPIGAYRNRRAILSKHNKVESEDGSMCGIGLCVCCAVSQDMNEIARQEPKQVTEQPSAAPAPSTDAAVALAQPK